MSRRSHLLLLVLLAGAAACSDDEQLPPPVPVEQVDLSRYLGTWYEIARLPNNFQDQCVANTTATYSRLDDGRIQVINRCETADGQTLAVRGVARPAEGAKGNARLEVSFFDIAGWRPAWGDYWIIGLDRYYDWAVVGHPEHKTAWILSRSPRLTDTTRERIDRLLQAQGYDPARFLETPHPR